MNAAAAQRARQAATLSIERDCRVKKTREAQPLCFWR
jgi:hypothetical protein